MKIAVLGSAESWYLKDLRRAAGDRHELSPVTFQDLRSSLGRGAARFASRERSFDDFQAVLARTMPPGSLEQVVFRMDALAQLARRGTMVLNPPRAIETAVDKYLASARLQEAGLTIPRSIVCQTADDAMLAFQELGGDVALKPLFGAEGRGIARLQDEALALRAFKMLAQLGAVLYLQEFVPHEGFDLRLLVIGERVLGVRRRNPLDWRTNLSRGAVAEPFVPSDEEIRLARVAADAVGAPLAGVDFLPGRDGVLYAIEVNAVPGWKGLAAATGVDVARLVLDYVEETVRKQARGA